MAERPADRSRSAPHRTLCSPLYRCASIGWRVFPRDFGHFMQESAPLCSPLQLRTDRSDRSDHRNAYRIARGLEGRQGRYRRLEALEAIHGANRRTAGCRRSAERGKDDNPQLRPAFYGDVAREQLAPEPIKLGWLFLCPCDKGRDATKALEGSFQRCLYAYRRLVREARQSARAFTFPKRPADNAGRTGVSHRVRNAAIRVREGRAEIQCER